MRLIECDEPLEEDFRLFSDGIFILRADNPEVDVLLSTNNGGLNRIKAKLEAVTDLSDCYVLYSLYSAKSEIWSLDLRAH